MPGAQQTGDQIVPTADEQRDQLARVLHSAAFRNTPGLQKFLEYVVTKTICGEAGGIKEYAVAVEVLGKPNDYDPRVDTSVRVQAHRLREKLEEYYATEGHADEILIELPKGHYVPQFSRRHSQITADSREPPPSRSAKLPPSAPAAQIQSSAELSASPHRGRALSWVAIAVAALVIFSAGIEVSPKVLKLFSPASPAPRHADPVTVGGPESAVRTVWAHFCAVSKSPLVAYSNSRFLVTETSDLLRLKSADVDGLGAPATGGEIDRLAENPRLVREAGPVFYEDGYTGTGEVMAVYDLTRFLLGENVPFQVERSQLITPNDLRNQNVVFLGSIIENPSLAGLPLKQDFVFSQPQRPPILWKARIVNLHPHQGERSAYEIERDPKTDVLTADYALVSFLPGVAPGREIVVLGGLTTIGTQAAAQFVTSEAGAQEILDHLSIRSPDSARRQLPPFFQVVVRVDVRDDEILSLHYITGHAIPAVASSS